MAVSEPVGGRCIDPTVATALDVFEKMLQRGLAPPVHPDSERLLLERAGLSAHIEESTFEGDATVRLPDWNGEWPIDDVELPELPALRTAPRSSYERLALDSGAERRFLNWIEETSPGSSQWVIPQAPYEHVLKMGHMLKAGAGLAPKKPSATLAADGPGSYRTRRVDFLFAPPGGAPTVFEVDGPQHEEPSNARVDNMRDNELRAAGILTLRVPTSELEANSSPRLEAVAQVLRDVENHRPNPGDPRWAAIQLHRFFLAVSTAVRAGALSGDRWVIEVEDPTGAAVGASAPYFQLMSAVFDLWDAGTFLPAEIMLIHGEDVTCLLGLRERALSCALRAESASNVDVNIMLELHCAPIADLPESPPDPCIIVRSTALPWEVTDQGTQVREALQAVAPADAGTETADSVNGKPVRKLPGSRRGTRSALREILLAIFAKTDFREGQAEAIQLLLAGEDCGVLLPTGSGKSIVYQLAGMCSPGCTLVISPLVALIDDQVRGLESHGCDRVLGITSHQIRKASKTIHNRLANADADFVLVAPERLQIREFREALDSLSSKVAITHVVIDEAHCVSEWGHDFRPCYLNVRRIVRRRCADGRGVGPALAALTGTASRPVLSDMLKQLEIPEQEDHIVRPATFDRSELRYRVVRAEVRDAPLSLRSEISAIPGRLTSEPAGFFELQGDSTNSGIVFTRTVDGNQGILKTREIVEVMVGSTTFFSGRKPRSYASADWESKKRANAREYVGNQSAVMISTLAFGMGIDKPNIRWVVHYGLPNSLEAYYQEAGRAGRDRKEAACTLILAERNRMRNRRLLNPNIELEEVRARHSKATRERSNRDFVTTALFLHLSSFPGVKAETETLELIVGELSGSAAWDGLISIPRAPKAHRFKGNMSTEQYKKEVDQESRRREQALSRLARLGAVDDYRVDYNNEQFDVFRASVTVSDLADRLPRLLAELEGAELQSFAPELTRDDGQRQLAAAIVECGSKYVQVLYDKIERSRRRSLREMYLAASQTDGDEFRQRILDYLNEGHILNRLEDLRRAQLSSRERFQMMPWSENLGRMLAPQSETTDLMRDDQSHAVLRSAREMQAATARLLESYPEHPGLLLCRGVAGMLTSPLDQATATPSVDEVDDLRAAALSARDRYVCDLDDIERSLSSAVGVIAEYRPSVVGVVLDMLDNEDLLARSLLESVRERALGSGSASEELRRWYLRYLLRQGVQLADEAIDTLLPVAAGHGDDKSDLNDDGEQGDRN